MISLSPRLPAHWASFDIELQLEGRAFTLHWQRDEHPSTLVAANKRVAWGEWVPLAGLADKAVLLVRGEAPPAAAAPIGQALPPAGGESVAEHLADGLQVLDAVADGLDDHQDRHAEQQAPHTP